MIGSLRTAARGIAATLSIALAVSGTAFAAPTPSPSPAPVDPLSSAIDVPLDSGTAQFRTDLAGKQAELEAFKAQLDQLDVELELAAEEYNAAVDRLEATKQQLEVTERDLENARVAYEVQAQLLSDRAREVYRDGESQPVEILLGSKSISDFVSRVKFIATMAGKDADVAAQLAAQKDQIEATAQALRQDQAEAEAVQFQLKAKQIEIDLRIAERQAMLENAEKELVDMLAAEAERRQAEQAVLLADILAGASKAGVVVQPGSPVETALAYHGVPYLWGGETPAGFDCSGLMLYVFKQHGVQLPHYSRSQFRLGERVEIGDLQPGDAVFFGSPIHHVGMYIGGGYYLHAPKTGDFVKVSRLADRSDYAGARRYPWQPRLAPIVGLDKLSPRTNHASGIQLQGVTR